MSLLLVTGPANAEKAGVVLGRVRELAQAGAQPILVVPTLEDVRAYRTELAEERVLLGVRVERFEGLLREVAARAGIRQRPASRIVREHVAREAAAACELGPTAASAATAGFAAALTDLAEELAGLGASTGRIVDALRRWGDAHPSRAPYAADLAALLAAYRDRLDRLGRLDPADADREALDVLRREPRRWQATPVVLYGFDDFTAPQLDAIETLARHAGAPVTVSLPFEASRTAFAARAELHGELAGLADETLPLPAIDPPGDPAAAALHAIERGLFEPAPRTAAPAGAVVLLEGGDPRAELELVAEHVRELLAAGTPAEAIVIAARDIAEAAPLIETVLGEADVPFALDRELPLGHTALGAGVLALLRCALPGGVASDVVRYLRTPGVVKRPALLDELERQVRSAGLRSAGAAIAAWDDLGAFALTAPGRVADAAGRGTAALCRRLATEATRLLAAPQRELGAGAGAARPLTAAEARDAAALRRLLGALDELGRLADREARLAPRPGELAAALAALRVPAGAAPGPGLVTVTSPLDIRGRRVDVLVLCRLQADSFPRAARPEPFLGDDERREITAASGLRLRAREHPPTVEQHLLYAAVSRPTDRLVLSWAVNDEDGEALARSLFVDDVLACLDPEPDPRTRRQGALAWDAGQEPSARQRELGERAGVAAAPAPEGAIGALTSDPVLARLREREAWSATELELFARCPVEWFAGRHLRPESLDPDGIPLARGTAGHAALELTLRALGRALTPATLDAAERLLPGCLEQALREHPITADRHRDVAERHRVEADLLRYLAHAAHAGSAFRPAHFELEFGGRAELPAVDLGDGLVLRGKIDRVDLSPDGRQAIIVDYKGRGAQRGWAAWVDAGVLQTGLYALALERLLDVEVVGALLQPIGADDDASGARGFVLDGADPGRGDLHRDDRIDAAQREALLAAVRERALDALARLRAGALAPTPETCGYRGEGCVHPTICRCAA